LTIPPAHSHRSANSGGCRATCLVPRAGATSDVCIRGRTAHRHARVADGDGRRDRRRWSAYGQRRQANGRSRDSTVACVGVSLSLYFRPNGVLVLYWEQRAWRGQSPLQPCPSLRQKGRRVVTRMPAAGLNTKLYAAGPGSWRGQLRRKQGGRRARGCESRVRHGGSWRLSRQSGAAQWHWHRPGVAGSGKRRPGHTTRRSPCLQERALTLATRLELPPGWSGSSKDAAACPSARQEPAPACCPRRPIAQVRSLCASTAVSTQVPDRNLKQRTPSPSLQDSAQRS
jgi:hypothetical protein